jgi:hypothetical protein
VQLLLIAALSQPGKGVAWRSQEMRLMRAQMLTTPQSIANPIRAELAFDQVFGTFPMRFGLLILSGGWLLGD